MIVLARSATGALVAVRFAGDLFRSRRVAAILRRRFPGTSTYRVVTRGERFELVPIAAPGIIAPRNTSP